MQGARQPSKVANVPGLDVVVHHRQIVDGSIKSIVAVLDFLDRQVVGNGIAQPMNVGVES